VAPQVAEAKTSSVTAPAGSVGASVASTPEAQQSPAIRPPQTELTQSSGATADRPGAGVAKPSQIDEQGPAPAKAKAPSVDRSRNLPATSASTTQPSKKTTIARPPETPELPPTLDLASLEQRLKDTRAIGVFTKLSLKNQVDDLLDQFRAYHRRESKTSLTELRQRYNLLLLKVLTLLQDSDAPLAAAISSSREAIWSILTDPEKFAKI
jgi:hypothetical protein